MKPRIHVMHEFATDGMPLSCSYIRLLQPLQHPSIAAEFDISSGLMLTEEAVDAVIVERLWHPHRMTIAMAEDLIATIRAKGAKLIYTLDDNLLDLHRDELHSGFPSEVDRLVVRLLLQAADAVIVSTEPLQQRCLQFNRRVFVVRNQLDERLFPVLPKPRDYDDIVIGYMGTFSHFDDLLSILGPLRSAMRRHQGKVRFEMVGITTNRAVLSLFEGYPYRIVHTGNDYHYPNFIPWARRELCWDIALAPLSDRPFNQYKSEIKYLDYGLLGFAGIYSDNNVYRNAVRHGENGLLAKDDAGWTEALDMLITDRNYRHQLVHNAFADVSQHRTWATQNVHWRDVLHQILD